MDDTHLCIKCSATIVGLENYILHRKRNCRLVNVSPNDAKLPATIVTSSSEEGGEVSPAVIPYEEYHFVQPEPATSASHGDKTTKSLTESYDLHYELGADVFFSSLQLQSVQPSGSKTPTTNQTGQLLGRKSVTPESHMEESWLISHTTPPVTEHDSEGLLKAVTAIGESKKSFESIFQPIVYEHESPDVTEEEDEEEMDLEMEDDDDDEDYDPMMETHGSGGKWKPTPIIRQHSPPVVPVSHTGGKWKPENRPNLRVTHSQLSRLSPSWEDQEDLEANEEQHPPSHYTKGKWIPGTKVQRLEYKEEVELTKYSPNQEYWCNICCRKLRSKVSYEYHLKTNYHLKRAEPEQQLEKAVIEELPMLDITQSLLFETSEQEDNQELNSSPPKPTKRKRRRTYLRCNLCKRHMRRHLVGKHLISHYHYRHMQLQPGASLTFILDNIHSVVRQSPFQCRPCHFYANTEESFLLHWNSDYHRSNSEGPGLYWCSYCRFECEDNNHMHRHLLGSEHKEVLLAINRSVPVCITKLSNIDCSICGQQFRYNFELRLHMCSLHPGIQFSGTASDIYQSRFNCDMCPEVLNSKIALQRHEKYKHSILKYFCSICNLEFHTPCQARIHRKTAEHKAKSAEMLIEKITTEGIEMSSLNKIDTSYMDSPCTSKMAMARERLAKSLEKVQILKCKDCNQMFKTEGELKIHCTEKHLLLVHTCMSCGDSYATAQALGRHTRHCTPAEFNTQFIEESDNEKVIRKGDWRCEECNFGASLQSELLYHQLYHTYGTMSKDQLIQCPLCDKSYRKHSLRCHIRQHTNEKIFECNLCEAKYSRQHHLKDHINRSHGNKSQPLVKSHITHQCHICGKVYKSKHSLKLHTQTQHDVAPLRQFVCPLENCNYSAVSKSLLKTHSLSHSTTSFKCEQPNCPYVGKSALHLKRHFRSIHAPDLANASKELYPCTKCKFTARTRNHFQRHMRSHTGERPYHCAYCDFNCSTWENLRKHVLKTQKHLGKFMYECEFCKRTMPSNKIFKTNSYQDYKKHLNVCHTN